jgi:hypothetical protein
MNVQVGDEVYCRGLITQTVSGDILAKKRGLFGWKYLCEFRVDNVDFGYSYYIARWRYRVIPVKGIRK